MHSTGFNLQILWGHPCWCCTQCHPEWSKDQLDLQGCPQAPWASWTYLGWQEVQGTQRKRSPVPQEQAISQGNLEEEPDQVPPPIPLSFSLLSIKVYLSVPFVVWSTTCLVAKSYLSFLNFVMDIYVFRLGELLGNLLHYCGLLMLGFVASIFMDFQNILLLSIYMLVVLSRENVLTKWMTIMFLALSTVYDVFHHPRYANR